MTELPPPRGWACPADRLVSAALASALRRLADPPGIRFTRGQLYYEVCRVVHPAARLPRRVVFTPRPAVGPERFDAALRRWGPVPALLPAVTARRAPMVADRDVLDYGLPRLLVCEDTSVARMLVANDVHLESACPILAEEDLPLDPRVIAALADFPGAVVHVLHDASAAGLGFAAGLRERLGLPPSVAVTSIGLLPRHARDLRLPALRLPPPGAADPVDQGLTGAFGLSGRDEDWVRGGLAAELAAVPPARLLRVVHRHLGHPVSPRRPVLGRSVGFLTWPVA